MITLKILKEDLLLNNYSDPDNCPITKAFARAGRPDLHHAGIGYMQISLGKIETYINARTVEGFQEMTQKVFEMMDHGIITNRYPILHILEPEDFEVTLPID